jgi:hypothetical protein
MAQFALQQSDLSRFRLKSTPILPQRHLDDAGVSRFVMPDLPSGLGSDNGGQLHLGLRESGPVVFLGGLLLSGRPGELADHIAGTMW